MIFIQLGLLTLSLRFLIYKLKNITESPPQCLLRFYFVTYDLNLIHIDQNDINSQN